MSKAVQAMVPAIVCSIMAIGALLHSVCNLKATEKKSAT